VKHYLDSTYLSCLLNGWSGVQITSQPNLTLVANWLDIASTLMQVAVILGYVTKLGPARLPTCTACFGHTTASKTKKLVAFFCESTWTPDFDL